MKRPILLVASLVVVASCGATTYDDSRVPPSSTAVLVPTIPDGPLTELLPRLVDELGTLSSYIGPRPNEVDVPDASKHDQLALIEALWSAVSDRLTSDDANAAETLGRMIDLARTAVERNRPADADKAAKFARIVIDDYLAKN